jgi:hypothetical protein
MKIDYIEYAINNGDKIEYFSNLNSIYNKPKPPLKFWTIRNYDNGFKSIYEYTRNGFTYELTNMKNYW